MKGKRMKRGVLWTGRILERPFAGSTPGQAHKGIKVRVPFKNSLNAQYFDFVH
jgi:hypothetical protein